MTSLQVSVIIPAYNQADYLADAVQSVLDQTYPHFEAIVVDDASPDHTAEVIKRFDDPRLKYIVHPENRMLPAARNTGIRASSGEIIALLDADDLFHREKLQAHVDFLQQHPEVGVTYNARFNMNRSCKTILDMWRPPQKVELSDLVLGFPFAPSDMVLRRDWLIQAGLFDESYTMFGEDLDINCRLALAGCQFAAVDRVLNYRRFHTGRIIKNLFGRLAAHLRALETAFSDPRCPGEVRALRDKAFVNRYLEWACIAFAQNETTLAQTCVREALRLDSSLVRGNHCELVRRLVDYCSAAEGVDIEVYLRTAFAQLPSETVWLSAQLDSAVARGYLLRGTRAVTWDRPDEGRACYALANNMQAEIDQSFVRQVAYMLLSIDKEFGHNKSQSIQKALEPYLYKLSGAGPIRQLKGLYAINQAFNDYYKGTYAKVPNEALRAIINDWKYLTNRGVLTIIVRSLWAIACQSRV